MLDTMLLAPGVLFEHLLGLHLADIEGFFFLYRNLSRWKNIPRSPNSVTGKYSCSSCVIIAEMH